ncbi:uncharacterized protein KY384_004008 [Bacidia gigantensis]|uniref:uncharacterized protein n=1 Tax=Bacidia gigantensis TaxID=2732470 RepID=UPI001D05904C|nr:uncharacterized protein KY384_004008 [Bacidia gigantensis]KAG8530653.1 hypothetical protein KY384_004008 [Bacidia gigantensis]
MPLSTDTGDMNLTTSIPQNTTLGNSFDPARRPNLSVRSDQAHMYTDFAAQVLHLWFETMREIWIAPPGQILHKVHRDSLFPLQFTFDVDNTNIPSIELQWVGWGVQEMIQQQIDSGTSDQDPRWHVTAYDFLFLQRRLGTATTSRLAADNISTVASPIDGAIPMITTDTPVESGESSTARDIAADSLTKRRPLSQFQNRDTNANESSSNPNAQIIVVCTAKGTGQPMSINPVFWLVNEAFRTQVWAHDPYSRVQDSPPFGRPSPMLGHAFSIVAPTGENLLVTFKWGVDGVYIQWFMIEEALSQSIWPLAIGATKESFFISAYLSIDGVQQKHPFLNLVFSAKGPATLPVSNL